MRARPSVPVTAAPPTSRRRAFAAAVLLGSALLAGCMVSPASGPSDRDEASGPTARSKSGGTDPILVCTRVWDAAAGDSVWNCPDPTPPASP